MKKLNMQSIEVGGVKEWDYPDFVDSFVEYAEWEDGTELTEAELDELNDNNPEIAQTAAMETFI